MKERLEIFIICLAVMSCCFSVAVIGTILFFKPMVNNGKFMPIILFISICDLGQNFASAFGFPDDNSEICWFQGIVSTYFTLSGWFWTTILAFRIYCLVRYSVCKLELWKMHAIAWGLPLVLVMLPLSSIDIGESPTGSQWCIFVRRGNNPRWLVAFWSYFSFFGWLFACSSLMILWHCIINVRFRSSPMVAVVKRTYDKVYLYPIAMICCWILNFICDDVSAFGNTKSFAALSMIFGISNGILSAIIFVVKSEEARRRWRVYLFKPSITQFENVVEPPIQCDFEDDRDDITDITDFTNTMSISSVSDISMTDMLNPIY